MAAGDGAILLLKGLTKIFAGHRAVDAIDLEIREGEMFTIVGPSGSGKTTLLRMLAGMESPTAGDIMLTDGSAMDGAKSVGAGTTLEQLMPRFGEGLEAIAVTNESGTVIRVDTGTLSVALTSGLPLTISPRFWRELGLSPWEADAIVQKMFFHYRFFYAAVNRANIPVGTEGPTSLENLRKMSFDLPVWPQQDVSEWRSFDEVRRGVPRV